MRNKNNISILKPTECCGCRVCADVCPTKCISFLEDSEGFFYPSVNEDKCISCGKCVKTCPEINPEYNEEATTAIAAYSEDRTKRDAGSSGGIFGLIATQIINRGGKVWGAAFDDTLRLRHTSAQSLSQLTPLLRSKYLQSDTSGIFSIIKEDIRSGILTLFSGTPCQCNAVRNIVGNSENLITVEIVCHGVPSQDLFDRSIKWLEEKEKGKVTAFSFRSKYKNALHPQAFSYTLSRNNNEERVNGLHYQFPFYFGFQRYITLRPSCYFCKWARPERTADITLGDFWGIENYNPSLDSKTGISEVIVNTEKGNKLIKDIFQSFPIWAKSYPIDIALRHNGCLQHPTPLPPVRKELFEALGIQSFDAVVDTFLTPKRKWIFDLYYGMPTFLRKFVRKVMDKRMKYE